MEKNNAVCAQEPAHAAEASLSSRMATAYRPGGLRRVGTYCDGTDHTELVVLEAAQTALDAGADPNDPAERDPGGGYDQPPLSNAAWFGHLRVVELLLAHGAEVNARGRDGFTALMQAAYGAPCLVDGACHAGCVHTTEERQVSIARLLLRHGAETWQKSSFEFVGFEQDALGLIDGDYPSLRRVLRAGAGWCRLRRLAPTVGRIALFVHALFDEVYYRPGGRGAQSCHDEFQALAT